MRKCAEQGLVDSAALIAWLDPFNRWSFLVRKTLRRMQNLGRMAQTLFAMWSPNFCSIIHHLTLTQAMTVLRTTAGPSGYLQSATACPHRKSCRVFSHHFSHHCQRRLAVKTIVEQRRIYGTVKHDMTRVSVNESRVESLLCYLAAVGCCSQPASPFDARQ